MTGPDLVPEPIIDENNTVVTRPCLRTVAYLGSGDAERERMRAVIALLTGSLRDAVTICSGTHLKPRKRRHRIGPGDLDALDAVLGPKAHFSGFMLFGDARLDASPFALPLVRVLRGANGFTVDLAFRPDVAVDWVVRTVWPVLREASPAYAYLAWGMLPFVAGHEHERRVSAAHKARYRAAACLDAELMANIVLGDDLAANHETRRGEPAQCGLYDIGWKTILGPRLLARVDRAALAASGAVVSTLPDEGIEITIGDRPGWGDVDGEPDRDAATRRKVLAALRPAMASKNLVLALGGLDDTAEAAEIIDAYFDG